MHWHTSLRAASSKYSRKRVFPRSDGVKVLLSIKKGAVHKMCAAPFFIPYQSANSTMI